MVDRLEIRPTRREYARVAVFVLLIAFQIFLIVNSMVLHESQQDPFELFVVLALFAFGLFYTVRGWNVDVRVDRTTSELVIRRSPLMFRAHERRGDLASATVQLEVQRKLFVLTHRSLHVFIGHELVLDLPVSRNRTHLEQVQALLQQAA